MIFTFSLRTLIVRLIYQICSEYGLGERLSDEDDKAVRAVLAYHPMYKKKVGCGVDYIKVTNCPLTTIGCHVYLRSTVH